MKRFLFSLAVTAAMVSPALADYLVIRINLSANVQDHATPVEGQGRSGGGFNLGSGGGGSDAATGAGSGKGAPGGGSGGRGLSAPPPNPGGGQPGQGAGAGGFAGGGRGLGQGAGAGQPGNRGGAGGGAGGFAGGGRGMSPPGAPGGLGSGPGGGPPGGQPGTGGLGGGGKGGGGAGMGLGATGNAPGGDGNQQIGQAEGNVDKLQAAKGDVFIVALEVSVGRQKNSNKVILSHKYGTTVLDPDVALPGKATMQLIKVPPLANRYSEERKKYVDGSATKEYMRLANWMIQNWNLPSDGKFSMKETFENYLTELTPLSASMNQADKAKLDALMQVRTYLAQAPSAPVEEMEFMKSISAKLGKEFKTYSKGHYLIYYHANDAKMAEAKAAKLEQALSGVLYWFALNGKSIQLPNKQFVCALADTTEKYKALRTLFDDNSDRADGFYAPQENITVLAPVRCDAAYDRFLTLATNAEGSLKAYQLDFRKLMSENPNRPHLTPANSNDNERVGSVITGQIFALAKNAALDEGETVTATNQALLQVIGASGALRRSVIMPKSIREGVSSFFSTPRSSGDLNLPTLWTGIGGPHWIYLPLFSRLIEARKPGNEKPEVAIDPKAKDLRKVKIDQLDIVSVVTDRVFDYAEKAPKADRDFLREKAKAEAWALTYFLMYNKYEQFRNFHAELSQMPSDLDLSAEVIEQAFGRAFGLLDEKGEKLVESKVGSLQKEWSDYMKFVNLGVATDEKK